MFGQQPFGTICDNANANFTLSFQLNLHPFFGLQNKLGGQGGVDIEKLGRFQVLHLNQTIFLKKSLLCNQNP
jgi:hypothetical protein